MGHDVRRGDTGLESVKMVWTAQPGSWMQLSGKQEWTICLEGHGQAGVLGSWVANQSQRVLIVNWSWSALLRLCCLLGSVFICSGSADDASSRVQCRLQPHQQSPTAFAILLSKDASCKSGAVCGLGMDLVPVDLKHLPSRFPPYCFDSRRHQIAERSSRQASGRRDRSRLIGSPPGRARLFVPHLSPSSGAPFGGCSLEAVWSGHSTPPARIGQGREHSPQPPVHHASTPQL